MYKPPNTKAKMQNPPQNLTLSHSLSKTHFHLIPYFLRFPQIQCPNSLKTHFSVHCSARAGAGGGGGRGGRGRGGKKKQPKKQGGSGSGGRIEGDAAFRRAIKEGARDKSRKMAETRFLRRNSDKNNKSLNHADHFTEDELQEIGLGYDRMVRFMDKDDPNLRHPYDWYKYGQYGPYSWRGVVVGDPIRGRFSDERVTLISEVRDQEEWEKIEQFEMATDFGKRLKEMENNVKSDNNTDSIKGFFKHFWVFVRHPKWRVNELPWEQWTLVCEVVVEAPKGRLDKWSLMGRFGNKARSLITQCAAWMRPDILYVKRPVYQSRFEPQEDFFKGLMPLLDPKTERQYLFEVRNEDGSVDACTYFGGLCKILRANPKAFVDDVVNKYEKLSDERKSECLEFLLSNHPTQNLLHPYTKEWKAKLEEMELGCDAPDDDEDGLSSNAGDTEVVEWIEDDGNDEEEEDECIVENDVDDDDIVMDSEEGGDDESGIEEEDLSLEEDKKFWEEEFQKAVSSADAMEKLAKRSVEVSNKLYKEQLREMESQKKGKVKNISEDGDETALRGKWPKVSPEEWKRVGYGPWRKRIKKSKIPPELFLRAAVRPFTYRNLVKEIILVRHGIVDGDFSWKE